MIKKVPATKTMLVEFYGRLPERTSRSVAFVEGEEILALLGTYKIKGRTILYSDIKPSVPKIRVWKETLKILGSLPACLCECTKGSEKYLTKLGFKPTDVEGVYEWQP